MARNGNFEAGNKVNANDANSTMGTQSAAGSAGASIINAAVDLAHVEKCREELKLMNIKSDVMREELNDAKTKMESSRHAIKTKEHSLNLLSSEKEDALERLRKVQREIQLITDF